MQASMEYIYSSNYISYYFLGSLYGSSQTKTGKIFSNSSGDALIYNAYLSLLILGRESISNDPCSGIGLWWVHALFSVS